MARIRDEERRTIWTPALEEQLAQDRDSSGDMTVFPGMMFTLAKDLMESTKLWKIIRRMPKGALLRMFAIFFRQISRAVFTEDDVSFIVLMEEAAPCLLITLGHFRGMT